MEVCSQEREQNLQRPRGRGTARRPVWGQGEGAGPRRCRAHRAFIVATVSPAASDRTGLEWVVKRGLVDLV